MKVTIRCQKCETLLVERDEAGPVANVSLLPCSRCTADLMTQRDDARREKSQAVHAAYTAARLTGDHRRALEAAIEQSRTALALAQQCVDLETPHLPADDVPF